MNCECLSMLWYIMALYWNSFVECSPCRIYQIPLLSGFIVHCPLPFVLVWPFIKAEAVDSNRWMWLAIDTNQPGQETKARVFDICDPLSENPALCANIEFELEAILSVQGNFFFVSQGAWTVSY